MNAAFGRQVRLPSDTPLHTIGPLPILHCCVADDVTMHPTCDGISEWYAIIPINSCDAWACAGFAKLAPFSNVFIMVGTF